LLKLVSVCPVYCRFCFRREMVGPGKSSALSDTELAAALDYIRAHSKIWEVILTGGDPFVLSPRRIAEVTNALSDIAHVKVLRWHTRVPAVAPERITNALTEALRSPTKTVYVALHANHPREMTAIARTACARIIDSGIAMVSQTVLLRGVNDDVDTLEAGGRLPLSILIEVAGRKMQPDFEPVLERQVHTFLNEAQGLWHMGQRDINWVRISKDAAKAAEDAQKALLRSSPTEAFDDLQRRLKAAGADKPEVQPPPEAKKPKTLADVGLTEGDTREKGRAKQRVKDAVLHLAHNLLALQAKRRARAGFRLPAPDDHFRAFEATFPYEETPDQRRAIEEVLAGLTDEVPMDRYVRGRDGNLYRSYNARPRYSC